MQPSLVRVLTAIFGDMPDVFVPGSKAELIDLALGGTGDATYTVAYDVPGAGEVQEAVVTRCRNGVAVNFVDPYMRRRDPDSLVVGDEGQTDKVRFSDRFGRHFGPVRTEMLAWLAAQPLVVVPFRAGDNGLGYDALLIAPRNAGFFAAALADLQGMLAPAEVTENFSPRAIIYLAPPFRHTVCEGRQVVVHHRLDTVHEIFSLNLYPGPSAKKGIYGVLLSIGAAEGWVTAHGSTVQVVTPYDNVVTFMHEGASGGGKSEMLEYPHREEDGRLLLGRNTVTGERRYLPPLQACHLRPVTDDMALCHRELQQSHKLVVTDAEDAWFVRINHITQYGTDPYLERLCTQPSEPLLFLNLEAVPHATCLIWEHIQDAPGQPCPNPRVIIPRRLAPEVVHEPVEVDVRSFGVRAPRCSRHQPSYGIMGLIHVLPPALGWLWRLVSPRGDANPSIVDAGGMTSEGVGSFWPFAAGRRVEHANALLWQIQQTPGTRCVLIPNQHVGAWQMGFMPQWLAREYLARRSGAKFRPDQLTPARCPLLGYTLETMVIEGTRIPEWLLRVEMQPEVGEEAYDAGAAMLTEFFHRELEAYLQDADLDPLGRRIIECCLDNGTLEEYLELLPERTPWQYYQERVRHLAC